MPVPKRRRRCFHSCMYIKGTLCVKCISAHPIKLIVRPDAGFVESPQLCWDRVSPTVPLIGRHPVRPRRLLLLPYVPVTRLCPVPHRPRSRSSPWQTLVERIAKDLAFHRVTGEVGRLSGDLTETGRPGPRSGPGRTPIDVVSSLTLPK